MRGYRSVACPTGLIKWENILHVSAFVELKLSFPSMLVESRLVQLLDDSHETNGCSGALLQRDG